MKLLQQDAPVFLDKLGLRFENTETRTPNLQSETRYYV